MAEQGSVKPWVVGSNPTTPVIFGEDMESIDLEDWGWNFPEDVSEEFKEMWIEVLTEI